MTPLMHAPTSPAHHSCFSRSSSQCPKEQYLDTSLLLLSILLLFTWTVMACRQPCCITASYLALSSPPLRSFTKAGSATLRGTVESPGSASVFTPFYKTPKHDRKLPAANMTTVCGLCLRAVSAQWDTQQSDREESSYGILLYFASKPVMHLHPFDSPHHPAASALGENVSNSSSSSSPLISSLGVPACLSRFGNSTNVQTQT